MCYLVLFSSTQRQNITSSAPSAEPQNPIRDSEQNTEPEEKFDAFGYYYIAGELPAAFRDIKYISIFTADYEYSDNSDSVREIPIPPEGFVSRNQMGQGQKMTRLNIGNDQISFATETITGISYQFTGRFLVHTSFYNLPQETVVLEGHLIKIRKGKKVAESNVRFFWYEGH